MILLMHLCYHREVLHTIDIFALKMEIFAGNHPNEFTKFLTEDRENISFLGDYAVGRLCSFSIFRTSSVVMPTRSAISS